MEKPNGKQPHPHDAVPEGSTTAASKGERRLYRILRGSYSRREGDKQPHVDPESGKSTKRQVRPFVHYGARTQRNPTARDEVYMSDAEARAFGLHHLQSITPRDVRTRDTPMDQDTLEEMLSRDLPEDTKGKINMLIEEGQLIRKGSLLKVWRQRVFTAELLDVEVPSRRQDVLDLLQRLEG